MDHLWVYMGLRDSTKLIDYRRSRGDAAKAGRLGVADARPKDTLVTDPSDMRITLRMTGARAAHGMSLADFGSFIDGLLAGLRNFDRSRRGEATRRSGTTDRRDRAVTAFRLLQFEPGSAIAVIEPESFGEPGQDTLAVGDLPLQVENLAALGEQVSGADAVASDVIDALAGAVGVLGDAGSLVIDLPEATRRTPVRIDRDVLERIRQRERPEPEVVSTVSGRLHSIDLEPDRIGVRAPDGTDWVCSYSSELEPTVLRLAGELVTAHGTGRRTGQHRGSMTIERVEPVPTFEQSPMFTEQRIPLDRLMAEQSIDAPQGLDALSDPDWDDEADAAYLDALLKL